ncbi:Crp/Fnr family transcriptional regulator [Saccharopolyspora phatthalungensis]|uniref:CRP-like cAMP-binding protein n=1 Tax=Saccharopolyspora phatthalungensis TaxID=664693 RepID=A0A840QEI9_9PSEU|nr:Crp/Fnr family transcriptional regulator [Saccharopolyspora phatthalungensis]MBB5157098.1 CRP-like cAMP-binding protein [Saccharopolyspora phatthalungensis]
MDGHTAAPASRNGDDNVGYALARGTFIKKAGKRVWAELRELGTQLHFDRNEMLIAVGAPSDHALLIEHGLVKVLLPGKGRELVAGIYGPGELMGEEGVLFSEPRSATLVAHTRGAATRVPGRLFRHYLDRNPAVLGALYGILRDRLRKADHRQLSLVFQDVSTRVARQLLAWSETLGITTADGVVISGLSRKDLSQCIGAGETTVDAVLKDFTSRGLVRTHWRKYVLPSPQHLLDHATREDHSHSQ